MSFSTEWETLYDGDQHASVWPWSDVVSLVMRFARPGATTLRVLELGAGAGANIPLFESINADYWAAEGSETAVRRLQQRFPQYAGQMIAVDFTREIPGTGDFDLILDRSSLTHNATSSIVRALSLISDRLSPKGCFIGVDWFSTDFSEFEIGQPMEDHFTREGFVDGRLAGTGVVHFADEPHIRELLSGYELLLLEHKTMDQRHPEDGIQFAAWNFVARKKGG